MSDDREEVEGLPTVAVRTRFPNAESTRWRYHDNPKHGIRVDTIEREKLVRRVDVETLIQDRLEKQEQRVDNLTGLDRVNLNDAKARREELKSLLDEVQQNP